VIEKLIQPVSEILDKFIADKDLKIKLQHELNQEIHKANLAQLEVNKVEAAHRNVFVAGWRPFTGWVCASALAYHFILEPIIVFGLALNNIQLTLPQFDMGSLLTVLMGMLGLGGLRTFEKTKGLTK
jgi:hypothetical protein|tara:strand:- start:1332 stop:1712 length:381 start_codon:yes stop_codon:yes gene_type:complete